MFGVPVGARVPESRAPDFAIPATFIAILAPILRRSALRAAALTGIAASLLPARMPWSSGVIVAGAIGMAVGAGAGRRAMAAEGAR